MHFPSSVASEMTDAELLREGSQDNEDMEQQGTAD